MRAIITKYFPAGNVRAPFILAKDCENNSVKLKIDDDLTDDQMHRKAAETLCNVMGWTDVNLIQGSLNHQEVFVMVPKKAKIEEVLTNIEECAFFHPKDGTDALQSRLNKILRFVNEIKSKL